MHGILSMCGDSVCLSFFLPFFLAACLPPSMHVSTLKLLYRSDKVVGVCAERCHKFNFISYYFSIAPTLREMQTDFLSFFLSIV
jgi:hypothetical protein